MSPSRISTSVDFNTFANIVNGQHRDGKAKHRGVDPTTGEELWEVPVGIEQDLNDAVAAGQQAFKSWSQTTIEHRREVLLQFVELWKSYENEFLELLRRECGKPTLFAKGEYDAVTKFMVHHTTFDLPVYTHEDDDKIITTTFKPLGVCGAICPWNFPLALCLGKIAPALVAGNVVVIKPSPFTPYTTLKLAELMQEVFPPGVVQAIGGNDQIGALMTAHPGIAKISFTGSIATGKKVMAACAASLKRVTLELGGNDPAIVLDDVDIAAVAPQVVLGAFFNSNQMCVATKRVYVHERIYRPFLDAMVSFIGAGLKVGKPDADGVLMGPIQNEMQFERVKGFFADSVRDGHKFATGAQDFSSATSGFFIQPALIDNPPEDSRLLHEEQFGPIIPCQPFADEDEAVRRANATDMGLGASVWSGDVARAQRLAQRLEVGSVWVNSFPRPCPEGFFSGVKQSGIGGEWGKLGMVSYCDAFTMHTYKKIP